ncbi:MAG: DUF1343 domain-containing protein [Chitinophagales bacterium]|nr:DUF1343 domain-containing protein [Chitinophagaceae bacterium]MCB9065689.1 DUF1343 domain-containing protein [Chitinophagales bacterium]
MQKISHIILFLSLMVCAVVAEAQLLPKSEQTTEVLPVVTGAEQTELYLPMLEGKRVGLLINQTSVVGDKLTLLPDTLLSLGVNVVKILAPEHGFRGKAEAGEKVDDEKDAKTGLAIVSLYGKTKKPTEAHLKDIDILIYDIQDVGARFYTYISTMQYAMEACAEFGVPFMILDRPNPNGFYVDGPVLDKSQKSFVGMQPIPVVYGMTPGEYAKMLVGQNWFQGASKLQLTVIPCKNYDHTTRYTLPVNPSPNLRNMAAIYCYPSLCFFEGTDISVGRGTDKPFQQFGHPSFKDRSVYGFMPNIADKGPDPKHAAKPCYGIAIATTAEEADITIGGKLRMVYLLKAYNWFEDKDKFFNSFFEKLAGTTELRKQVQQGWNEEQIRDSWKKDIDTFKQIRKKYLLYKDFE